MMLEVGTVGTGARALDGMLVGTSVIGIITAVVDGI